ncbi:hypothetical protein [Variovorax saccharolyticus]|uniref:hypothetical protein n=1 Tax=Variovorax saccharolyticus TaxID=3053516 RepID=UPI004037DC0B
MNLATLGTNGFALSEAVSANLSVSSAGDVNGDGLADLIVASNSAGSNTGRSYVVFGQTGTTGFDLSSLTAGTSTKGFAINGEGAGDFAGLSVSSAGDVNGDGLDDLLVGADGGDAGAGLIDAGNAYVVFGKGGGAVVNLSSVAMGIGGQGFVIKGESAGWGLRSVSSAGDVNGDGFGDLIVGSNGADVGVTNSGRSYVIYGGPQYLDKTVNALVGVKGQANPLMGTIASETLIGREKDDTLSGGGGADVFYGGAGKDIIELNNDNVAHLNDAKSRIDGGTGVDMLRLFNTGNVGMTLDLSVVGNSKITGIEHFDLTGLANNTLKLSALDLSLLQDAEGQSGSGAFKGLVGSAPADANRIQVMIDGNAGDRLVLSDLVNWSTSSTVTAMGHTYAVYNDTARHQLLVDQTVLVTSVL